MRALTLKLTGLLIVSLALGACTERQFVKGVLDAVDNSVQFVGIKDRPNTMKTPDYYSTQSIAKNYQFGRAYPIEHLNCDFETQNCESKQNH